MSSGAGTCEKRRGEKRRASAGEGRDVVLLPVLMEAARLLQYKSQYRSSLGRAAGLRASLRVTCEEYLKLVGASQFTRDSGALRLMRLLIETHVQAQARTVAKSPSWSEPRSMKERSMVQLAELTAREYVAEMKGEEVFYTSSPVPVEAFRPVKKQCRAAERDAAGGVLYGELPRVAERSAFTSVSPGTTDSVISSSKRQSPMVSDGVVPETDLDNDGDSDEEEDEDEVCRADGKNLAQCMCYKCALGED